MSPTRWVTIALGLAAVWVALLLWWFWWPPQPTPRVRPMYTAGQVYDTVICLPIDSLRGRCPTTHTPRTLTPNPLEADAWTIYPPPR